MADNIIKPNQKRQWGWGGEEGNIVPSGEKAVNVQAVGSGEPEEEEARHNGGGFPSEDDVTLDYLTSKEMTKEKLLALAQAHGIELDKPAGKKDEILAELKEYYEL